MDKGDIIVESGRVEGRLRRSEMIPKENLRTGDRVRAMIMEVDLTLRGAPIILSRSAPAFMIELFRHEVPGDRAGPAGDQSCARDPGSRAKIAVLSHDKGRSHRHLRRRAWHARQRGHQRAGGRAVDIVLWSEDPAQFVIARWRQPTSRRSWWTKSATPWTWWWTRKTWPSPSAVVARTCAWRPI